MSEGFAARLTDEEAIMESFRMEVDGKDLWAHVEHDKGYVIIPISLKND